jgi:heme exporter protein A
MSNRSGPALAAHGVDVWRGERRLISGLSFTLGAGQLALVVGPNGVGKTSLLRILAGLAPCVTGRIEWRGAPLGGLVPEDRAGIVYRGHLDGLKKELSVEENLSIYAGLRRQRAELGPVLTDLSLGGLGGRPVRYLSAGQRRRVGLAALRISGASLWLLDEPMTNLDATGRTLVATWVNEHLDRGGLAVIATHQPEELMRPGSTLIEL